MNYYQQFNEFIRKVESLTSKYGVGVSIPTKNVPTDGNMGSASIFFTFKGDDIVHIDYYYDYAEDPDYPDRDWFVTFNMKNYVTNKSNRYDFFNNDEALSFLEGFFPVIIKKLNELQ